MKKGKIRILFVCLGNICRSPAAEAILKFKLSETGIDKNITPHALRHNFATDLLKETHDIKLVATALGHADIGTTQI